MFSKLPKPSGSKCPQIKFDLKPKFHEAPVGTDRLHFSSRLQRRSKSVTDLRSLVDKPTKTVLPFKPLPKLAQNELKHNAQTKDLNTKGVNRPVVMKPGAVKGTKRHLPNESDDPPKPKTFKKIPDWDYKGRFHQLNEKYQHVQESVKNMKFQIIQFDELKSNCEKAQEEAKLLRETKEILEEKCRGYDEVKSELIDLKCKHANLEEEHQIVSTKNKYLESENDNNLQRLNKINKSYETLSASHDKLLADHKELNEKFAALTKKFNVIFEENKNLSENFTSEQKEKELLQQMVFTMQNDLQKFDLNRRILHNIIQDLKGNIRVFCRVRPPLASEMDNLQCCISYIDENGLEIRKSRESVSQITGKPQECKSEFVFDKVFSHESTQQDIFEDLAELVQSALDGYNVCVFAYGQTGSGKTYTMQGGEGSDRGMIPRTISLIFESMEQLKRRGLEYSVQASFLEIYNENIRDLLNLNNGQKLEIYSNEGRGTTVTNLTKQPISSAGELEHYMRQAHSNRATAATDFNEHSSRSHAVMKIYLQGTLKSQNTVYSGSINLVDLAGSECAKQSVIGDRLTETKNINKSLATLGDVIWALHNKAKHIPYRNSKLTYLLQSCLGGNSKTLMIVNIAPFEECFGESINSLRFAAKVKEVKTGSKRNKMIKQKTTIN